MQKCKKPASLSRCRLRLDVHIHQGRCGASSRTLPSCGSLSTRHICNVEHCRRLNADCMRGRAWAQLFGLNLLRISRERRSRCPQQMTRNSLALHISCGFAASTSPLIRHLLCAFHRFDPCARCNLVLRARCNFKVFFEVMHGRAHILMPQHPLDRLHGDTLLAE
jgi:hypothetical protein